VHFRRLVGRDRKFANAGLSSFDAMKNAENTLQQIKRRRGRDGFFLRLSLDENMLETCRRYSKDKYSLKQNNNRNTRAGKITRSAEKVPL
jgi:hypothetical protein